MKSLNPNIYPKSGHIFRDSDGSVHTADSWAGVVRRVKAYRARQGRPVDSVANDVILQACQREPVLCVEDDGQARAKLAEASLKSRVLGWLSRMVKAKSKGEVVYVSEQLRDARADVCNRCPLDKSLPEGCGSCKMALKELQGNVLGHRKGEPRYAACPVLGEYLSVSVWIEQQAVADARLPWECWRKKTL